MLRAWGEASEPVRQQVSLVAVRANARLILSRMESFVGPGAAEGATCRKDVQWMFSETNAKPAFVISSLQRTLGQQHHKFISLRCLFSPIVRFCIYDSQGAL